MSDPAPGGSAGDAELLAAHVAGSQTAFAELVQRHQNRLWAVALRMVRDPDDAADLVQDALVKAFRKADSFRGDAAVSTWLHRIVVTTALDALRSASRTPVAHLVDLEPADAHDSVSAREAQLDVAAALATIPDEQRAAIVLVDLGGFSVDEAAWALQCPVGTVKSRCSRGRARLAVLLHEYGGEGGAPDGNRARVLSVQPDEPGIRPRQRRSRDGRDVRE
jgi:RNA polymerase sigma-70 factor (ECF subfamily)